MESDTDGTADATRRLNVKKQTLDDAYAVPANFLEIDVLNPKTSELPGKKRYTEYEVNMRVGVCSESLQVIMMVTNQGASCLSSHHRPTCPSSK